MRVDLVCVASGIVGVGKIGVALIEVAIATTRTVVVASGGVEVRGVVGVDVVCELACIPEMRNLIEVRRIRVRECTVTVAIVCVPVDVRASIEVPLIVVINHRVMVVRCSDFVRCEAHWECEYKRQSPACL